ncbi:hypothetical protein [Bacteroides sp.]|uniref:hypothetical protein n=1 Tax=Bacteroides sp. TaxID=29523 RepID=UPI002A82DE40|nr:hypothetical protein [Bacteroides sp.]
MNGNTLYEFLFGIKRVDVSCFALFAPFYAERAKHYVYPVFYQSISQMIAAKGFFYKIFKKQGRSTLAIFKRSSIMGNYSVMLHIAPISLQNNRQDEINIIQEARKLGISLKICREDIQRYCIPIKLCEAIKGNVEYIYNVNECYNCKGGKFHGFRRQRTRITRLSDYRHTEGVNSDIQPLVKKWDDHNHCERDKSHQTSQLSDWKNLEQTTINIKQVHIHSIYVGRTLECFSVIEQLSPKHWAFVMGMRNYDSQLNDVNVCMHWLDCEIAHDDKQIAVYANMGASLGIDGLSAAKEKLKPCAKQQIYKVAPVIKLDFQQVKQLFK